MTRGAGCLVAVGSTRLIHCLGDIVMTVGTESRRRIPLKTDCQGGMCLMANLAIGFAHLLAMTEMATETGRHTGMPAMASDTITVMGTRILNKLCFNLRVTAGTDRTVAAHPDQIILKRLMGVVTIETPFAGKMRCIIRRMAIGAFGDDVFSRGMILVTLDTADFGFMCTTTGFHLLNDARVAGDTGIYSHFLSKCGRQRAVRFMALGTVDPFHILAMTLMTIQTSWKMIVCFVTLGAIKRTLVCGWILVHLIDYVTMTAAAD